MYSGYYKDQSGLMKAFITSMGYITYMGYISIYDLSVGIDPKVSYPGDVIPILSVCLPRL